MDSHYYPSKETTISRPEERIECLLEHKSDAFYVVGLGCTSDTSLKHGEIPLLFEAGTQSCCNIESTSAILASPSLHFLILLDGFVSDTGVIDKYDTCTCTCTFDTMRHTGQLHRIEPRENFDALTSKMTCPR